MRTRNSKLTLVVAVLAAAASAGCTSDPSATSDSTPTYGTTSQGWTPTGELVYVTLPADRSDDDFVIPAVHTINADGSGGRALPLTGFSALWSRDGKRLLVSGLPVDAGKDHQFRPAMADADGGRRKLYRLPRLPSEVSYCHWTPDEWSIVCDIGRLVRIDLATSQTTILTEGPEDKVWDISADGRILYAHQASATDGIEDVQLWTINADGTGRHKLTDYGALAGAYDNTGGSWVPDGSAIVAATPTGGLVKVDATTGQLTEIPLDRDLFAAEPVVSPDGTTIAFDAPGQDQDLYVTPIDGGPVALVAGTEDAEIRPQWRPSTPAPTAKPSAADRIVDDPGAELVGWAVSADDPGARVAVWRARHRVAVVTTTDGFTTRVTRLLSGRVGHSASVVEGDGWNLLSGITYAGAGSFIGSMPQNGNYHLSAHVRVATLPPLIRSDGSIVQPRLDPTPKPLGRREVLTGYLVDRGPAELPSPAWHSYDVRLAAVDPVTASGHPIPNLPGASSDVTSVWQGEGDALNLLVTPIGPVGTTDASSGYWRSDDGGATWRRTPVGGKVEVSPVPASEGGPIAMEESAPYSGRYFGPGTTYPIDVTAWWRSTDGGTSFDRIDAFTSVNAAPETGGTAFLLAAVLPDSRLCVAVTGWSDDRSGRHRRPIGFWVSHGRDWSRMHHVTDIPAAHDLYGLQPTAGGLVVRTWSEGAWFFDGHQLEPLPLR